MNVEILATGLAAAGHGSSGGVFMMLAVAVVAVVAIAAFGVTKWRQKRVHDGGPASPDRPAESPRTRGQK